MKSVALVSHLAFPINGRDYGSEDKLLAEQLQLRGFAISIVHPEMLFPVTADQNTILPANEELLSSFDAIFCRNNYGGKLEKQYRAALEAFYTTHPQSDKCFNDFKGCRGDYRGKQHLLDLFEAGYPVIPSTINVGDLDNRAPFNAGGPYLVKSMTGADSNDIKKNLTKDQARQEFVEAAEGNASDAFIPDPLLQPMVEFEYEVSFFFFEGEFMYAVYNGQTADSNNDVVSDTDKRWSLKVYDPTEADMNFAMKFVTWNQCSRQIQRIDACRCKGAAGEDHSGPLLLMEVEDYNCWLSLSDVRDQRPGLFDAFMERIAASLHTFIEAGTQGGS